MSANPEMLCRHRQRGGSHGAGTVLPGGADWQVVQADGLARLDTRYTLQTDGGTLIYIQNAGVRHASPEATRKLLAGETVDPSEVYFKTAPTFETSGRIASRISPHPSGSIRSATRSSHRSRASTRRICPCSRRRS